MKLEMFDNGARVTLSKRNLQTLLNKLEREDSHRTLFRITEAGNLVVVAEPDEKHYADRKPGAVHPADEPKKEEEANAA